MFTQNKKHEKRKYHGMSKTHIYKSYHTMMNRCYDEDHRAYKYYGGRDNPIKVCERWHDVLCFLEDARKLPGYISDDQTGLTLDRIDPDGDYSPENCRWATNLEQQNNKRNNVYYNYAGEKHTLAEIARIEGVSYKRFMTVYKTFKDKESIEYIVERSKKTKKYNLAEVARTNEVPYAQLYHWHITRGMPLEDAIEKSKKVS